MDYLNLIKHLKSQQKKHLVNCFSNLLEVEGIDQELLKIDLSILENQLESLETNPSISLSFSTFNECFVAKNQPTDEIGLQAARAQEVGCIVLAGGQGSRLGFSGPKGMFPISNVTQMSLFEILAKKVLAASKMTQQDLPLAIMTSPLNEKVTRSFFEEHSYFGLKESQIFLFSQPMLPFLDFEKKLLLDENKKLAYGPDGNGSFFQSFFESKVLDAFEKRGVKYLNFVLIDNPLAEPFDFKLIGHMIQNSDEVTLKSCQRQNPEEKVGIIVKDNGKVKVVEYHELPKDFIFEKEPPASLSLMALTIDFAKRMALKKLPLHIAKKKAPYFDLKKKQIIKPKEPNVWKFEKYIFDAFLESKKTSVLLYPREEIFAPLKDQESIEEVKKALLNKDRILFEKLLHQKAPSKPFELPFEFYYPSEDFKQSLKSQNLSHFFQ